MDKTYKTNKVRGAAENFISHDEKIAGVAEFDHGIIHDTYLVKLQNTAERFILQRINTQVFASPEAVMHNLRLICEHVHERMKGSGSRIESGWQMLQPIPAGDNRDFFIDPEGTFWRALSFIREADPLEHIACLDDAREVGRALGIFHLLTGTWILDSCTIPCRVFIILNIISRSMIRLRPRSSGNR